MAISTYAELQDQIYRYLIRDTSDLVVTPAQVQNYIALAEAELSRLLKIRLLQETATLTLAASQNYVALPTGFRSVLDLNFDARPTDISYLPPKELRRKYAAYTGRPYEYSIIGSRIYFGPTPTSVETLTLDYYKKITALSDAANTNNILTEYPDVYLFSALKAAFIQIGDQEKLENVAANLVSILKQINDEDVVGKVPVGSRMVARRGAIG